MPGKSTATVVMFLIVTLLQSLLDLIIDDDDELITNTHKSYTIGDIAARDIYGDIVGTAYFRHWFNGPPAMYEYRITKINSNLKIFIRLFKVCKSHNWNEEKLKQRMMQTLSRFD